KKLLSLLGLTIAIAYIANLTRVTTLYLVAFYYGSEAMMTVHEHLGWIIFLIVVTAILYIISRVSPSAKM
ncbi:MAG: archaeosortase/exosortase family protein, partial [Candidatus Hadarchaeota archaeon]